MKGQKTSKDSYVVYAKKLLKDNPDHWSRYAYRTSHGEIFRRSGTKVVLVMSYPKYKNIIATWFKLAIPHIIRGEALVLGNNLGRIAGRRVERNFEKKEVNWKATNEKWKETGVRKGLVYFLDDEWVRIGWSKTGKVKNGFLYRFSPAEGNATGKGFKMEFSKANQENPYLKNKYEFFPHIPND